MAELNISERNRLQTGKVNFRKFADVDLDLRVSTMPTSEGSEDLVITLLGKSRCMPVNAIGFNSRDLDRVIDTISARQGLFVVTGPTGSGKTSTLHSLISYLNNPERKICTLEDPIAVKHQGVRQMQINEKSGMDFAKALDAALIARPDILMVEDIRDAETARGAVQAALNGHLVLAGMSADTAIDGIQRLLDLGVSHLDAADSLLGVASQRLVRTLCNSCKKSYQADTKELVFLASEFCQEIAGFDGSAAVLRESVNRVIQDWEQRLRIKEHFTLYKSTGCRDCLETGYRGQIGVHQLMLMTPEIRRLVINKVSREQIREKSMRLSMHSLKQDGIEKVLQGYTDFSQVRTL